MAYILEAMFPKALHSALAAPRGLLSARRHLRTVNRLHNAFMIGQESVFTFRPPRARIIFNERAHVEYAYHDGTISICLMFAPILDVARAAIRRQWRLYFAGG